MSEENITVTANVISIGTRKDYYPFQVMQRNEDCKLVLNSYECAQIMIRFDERFDEEFMKDLISLFGKYEDKYDINKEEKILPWGWPYSYVVFDK